MNSVRSCALVTAALLLTSFLPTRAFALHPCETNLDDYRQLLHSELHKRAPGRAISTFLAIPSFVPEYGLVFSELNGASLVTVVRFTESVWYGSVEETKPGRMAHVFSPSKVKAKAEQFPISTELAALLRSLLAEEIPRAAPREGYGLDGETYVFTLADGGCAETWSPEEGTRDNLLVKTFEQVGELAGAPTQILRAAGEQRLLATLKARWKR